MSDLLKENRFILFARGLSRTIRLTTSICILLFTFIIWLFYFYLPTTQSLYQQKLLLKENLDRNNIISASLSQLNPAVYRKKELLTKSQLLTKSFYSGETNIDLVLESLNEHDLCCFQFSPAGKKDNQARNKSYYDFKVKGSFFQFANFLNNLGNNYKNIKIKRLKIEKKKEKIVLFAKLRVVQFIKTRL